MLTIKTDKGYEHLSISDQFKRLDVSKYDADLLTILQQIIWDLERLDEQKQGK